MFWFDAVIFIVFSHMHDGSEHRWLSTCVCFIFGNLKNMMLLIASSLSLATLFAYGEY